MAWDYEDGLESFLDEMVVLANSLFTAYNLGYSMDSMVNICEEMMPKSLVEKILDAIDLVGKLEKSISNQIKGVTDVKKRKALKKAHKKRDSSIVRKQWFDTK